MNRMSSLFTEELHYKFLNVLQMPTCTHTCTDIIGPLLFHLYHPPVFAANNSFTVML